MNLDTGKKLQKVDSWTERRAVLLLELYFKAGCKCGEERLTKCCDICEETVKVLDKYGLL